MSALKLFLGMRPLAIITTIDEEGRVAEVTTVYDEWGFRGRRPDFINWLRSPTSAERNAGIAALANSRSAVVARQRMEL